MSEIGSDQHNVVDRYEAFGAEVLRLSLLGIGGIGFLITNAAAKQPANASISFSLPEVIRLTSWSLIAFGIAAASALAHRYLLATGLGSLQFHQTAYLRANEEGNEDERRHLLSTAQNHRLEMQRSFSWARLALLTGSATLAAGGLFLAGAFIQALRHGT